MKQMVGNVFGQCSLWLARKIGLYRSWRLFHEIRRLDPTAVSRWFEYVMRAEWPERIVSDDFLIHYLNPREPKTATEWPLKVDDEKTDVMLDAIPSETSAAERRFLYHFFRSVWDGQDHVLEIGPFLGGTTRAIALGMLENPKRQPSCRLYTADRFSMYYEKEALAKFLEPLFASHVLSAEDRALINEQGCFRDVFTRIHQKHDYFPLVTIMEGILPDLPEQIGKPLTWINPKKNGSYSAFFIDGCKSWYGTKYFLQCAAECARPGAFFIFQDYGWFTCFWLPMCLSLLNPDFRLMTCIHNTYAFQLARPLDLATIDRVIPDTPSAFTPQQIGAIFDVLTAGARERRDQYGMIAHRLQQVAALAYTGHTDDARRLIQEVERAPSAGLYSREINISKQTPTYRPVMLETGEVTSEVIHL